MTYITFTNKDEQELLHLHFQGIKKSDKTGEVIYITPEKLDTPKGSLNLFGIDISQRGHNNFLKLLSCLKVLAENHGSTLIVSKSSVVFRSPIDKPLTTGECDYLGFMSNENTQSLNSCFGINLTMIENILKWLEQPFYYDLFNRDPLETLQGLCHIVCKPERIRIMQCVLPNQQNALVCQFNGNHYSNIQVLKSVILFVECANIGYLKNYLMGRIPPIIPIKRAMSHCLHVWKK